MPSVTYILHDGTSRTHALHAGQSVMVGATTNAVPGILAECGGACMCATCHVYVDEGAEFLPPISEEESDMLDAGPAERRPESRLSCQLRIAEHLGVLVIRVADNR